jgi:hypothetical protein
MISPWETVYGVRLVHYYYFLCNLDGVRCESYANESVSITMKYEAGKYIE